MSDETTTTEPSGSLDLRVLYALKLYAEGITCAAAEDYVGMAHFITAAGALVAPDEPPGSDDDAE